MVAGKERMMLRNTKLMAAAMSSGGQRGMDGWRDEGREGGIDLGLYPNKALARSHSSFALPFPYQRTV